MGIKPTDLLNKKDTGLPQDVRQPCWIDFTQCLFTFHLYNHHTKSGKKIDVQWFVTDCYVRASDSWGSLFQWYSNWDGIIIHRLAQSKNLCVEPELCLSMRAFCSEEVVLYEDNEHFISRFNDIGWNKSILENFTRDRDLVAKHSSNKKTCWGEFFG